MTESVHNPQSFLDGFEQYFLNANSLQTGFKKHKNIV